MIARFLIAKYAPDLRRMEPHNIGIIAWREDGSTANRFLGDDRPIPRTLRLNDRKTYREWVAAWKSMCASPAVEDERGDLVSRTSPKFLDAILTYAKGNFMLVDGGLAAPKFNGEDPQAQVVADSMFDMLVAEKRNEVAEQESTRLKKLASTALRLSGLLSREDLLLSQEIEYRPFRIEGSFKADYAFGSPQKPYSVIQRVPLIHKKSFDSTIYHLDWFCRTYNYAPERCAALVCNPPVDYQKDTSSNLSVLKQVAKVVFVDDPVSAVDEIKKTASLNGHV